MKYVLLLYGDENALAADRQAHDGKISPAYLAYLEAVRDAGIMLGGDRLQRSSTASTVRVVDGKPTVLDGPYAEAKEQLGGYFMIDVPDLDAALAWAARCPGAYEGTIEVRPIWST